MFKKKIISLFLIFAVWFVFDLNEQVSAANHIDVFIDGEKQNFSQAPQNINGSVMVPMRDIFEYFDVKVNWNQKNKTISATKNELSLLLTIGSIKSEINEKRYELTSAPVVINSTTMVPLRFISESLGTNVQWASVTQHVYISTHFGQLSGQAKLNAEAMTAWDTDGELYRWKLNVEDGTYSFSKVADQVLDYDVYYGQPMYVRYDGTVWGWDWYTWDNGEKAQQFKGIKNAIKVIGDGTYSLNSISYVDTNKNKWFRVMLGDTLIENRMEEKKYTDIAYYQDLDRHYSIDKNNKLYATGRPQARGFDGISNVLGTGNVTEDTMNRYYSRVYVTDQVNMLAAGSWHAVIKKKDGTAWTWGTNIYGELGDGTTQSRLKPVKIASSVKEVSAGNFSTLILKHDGTVWGAGHYSSGIDTHMDVDYESDPFGIVLDYTPNPYLIKIEGLPKIETISADSEIGYGLTADGDIYFWGRMFYGNQIKPELLVKDGVVVYEPILENL